jgi:hypothetical protein
VTKKAESGTTASGSSGGPVGALLNWAGQLRFPYLLGLTALLFVVDLVVPDFVPFADEILLGLATVVFGTWRKRRRNA